MSINIQQHHITPKCMLKHKDKFFINDSRNLINLKYNYHVAAHKWLFMLTGNFGCEFAYISMIKGRLPDRTGISVSKETRKKKSNNIRGNKNPIYGLKGRNNPKSLKWIINGKIFYGTKEAEIFFNVSKISIQRWCNPKSKYHIPLCYSFK